MGTMKIWSKSAIPSRHSILHYCYELSMKGSASHLIIFNLTWFLNPSRCENRFVLDSLKESSLQLLVLMKKWNLYFYNFIWTILWLTVTIVLKIEDKMNTCDTRWAGFWYRYVNRKKSCQWLTLRILLVKEFLIFSANSAISKTESNHPTEETCWRAFYITVSKSFI